MRALLAENGLAIDGVTYDDFSGLVLVADDEGTVIGMAQALPGKPYAVMTEFAVARSRQNGGVGLELIKGMELLLRAAGCAAWVGFCAERNDKVIRSLDAFGAWPTGTGLGWVKRL